MTVPDKHGRDYIPGLSHHPVTLSATEMALRAVHFEEGIMLARDGRAPPAWELRARKDIFRIGDAPDSTRSVDIAIRFREFMGSYVEHLPQHTTRRSRAAVALGLGESRCDDPRAVSNVGRRLLQAIIRVGAKLKDPSARD